MVRGLVLPTGRGALVALIAMLLYFLAYQSHVGWYYVADAVAWALLLVNVLLPRWSLRGLTAQRRLTLTSRRRGQGVFEGDAVQITLDLENCSRFPRFFFQVRETCILAAPGEQRRHYLVGTLGPRSRLPIVYDALCHQRGAYQFGPLELESSLPFGLFRARRRLAAPLHLLVYPEVFPSPAAPARSGLAEGPLLGPPVRSPGEFRSSRQYQSGDSLRHVHWRRSARERRLMVREYDALAWDQVTVLFDAGRSFGAGKVTTLEYAIKLAASIAQGCFLQGIPFHMAPPGPEVTFPHWRAVLEHLAGLRLGEAAPGQGGLALEHLPGRVVAVLAAADPDAPQRLARLPSGKLSALVALRGFAPEQEGPQLADEAHRRGVMLVPCTPGGVAAALEQLSLGMGAPRTVAGAARPARR